MYAKRLKYSSTPSIVKLARNPPIPKRLNHSPVDKNVAPSLRLAML